MSTMLQAFPPEHIRRIDLQRFACRTRKLIDSPIEDPQKRLQFLATVKGEIAKQVDSLTADDDSSIQNSLNDAVQYVDDTIAETTSKLVKAPPQRKEVEQVTVRRQDASSSSPARNGEELPQNESAAERLQTILVKQKDMVSQEIEDELQQQRMTTKALAQLTSILKDATLSMHESVKEQNLQLDAITEFAAKNMEELGSQKDKLTQREKKSTQSFFGSLMSMLWVVALFVATYIVIRIFPKP